MFKQFSQDTQFIVLTLFLVISLGVPTVHTLVSEPAVTPAVSSVLTVAPTRKIAAIEAGIGSREVMTMHDFGCSKVQHSELQIRGDYFQLSGRLCHFKTNLDQMTIVNKRNGFTASIFDRGSGVYQTDLIQLDKGENEIVIRYQETSGKEVQEILKVQAL